MSQINNYAHKNELRQPSGNTKEGKANEYLIRSMNPSRTLARNTKLKQTLNEAEIEPPNGGHTTTTPE
jgi:hypothetical protein